MYDLIEMPPTQQMYIISNVAKVNGAAHEVIAVSTDLGTPETLSEMVREVNGSPVSERKSWIGILWISQSWRYLSLCRSTNHTP